MAFQAEGTVYASLVPLLVTLLSISQEQFYFPTSLLKPEFCKWQVGCLRTAGPSAVSALSLCTQWLLVHTSHVGLAAR